MNEQNSLDRLASDASLRARLAAVASEDTFVPRDAPALIDRRAAMRDIVRALMQAYWNRDDAFVRGVSTGEIPDDIRAKIGAGGVYEVRRLATEFWTRAATASTPLANAETQIIMPAPESNATVIMPRYLDGKTGPAPGPSAEKTEIFYMPYDDPLPKPNK